MTEEGTPRTSADMFWGVIRGAVGEGRTRQEIFDAVKADAEARGLRLPSLGAVAFNELIGAAGALERATVTLARSAESEAITARHIAYDPYGNRPGWHGGQRVYNVRVGYSATFHGEPVERAVTLQYTGGLPATVGELRSEAFGVAQELVAGYDVEGVELGDLEISEL